MRDRRSLHLAAPSSSHWIPIWAQSTALLQQARVAGRVCCGCTGARERTETGDFIITYLTTLAFLPLQAVMAKDFLFRADLMWLPGAAAPLLAIETVDGARYPHRMGDDRSLALVVHRRR